MFGETFTFASVLADVNSMVVTLGVGPIVLTSLIAGVAGAVLRTVKRSAK